MKLVGKDKMKNIAPLFGGWNEVGILSCLQGHVGQAFVDNEDVPSVAMICHSGFCYVAGDAESPRAKELLWNIHKDCMELQLRDEEWQRLAEREFGKKIEKFTRYKFKRNAELFDREKLQGYIDALPDGYEIAKIDERMFKCLRTYEWAEYHCAQFISFEELRKYAIGFVVLYDGEPICAATPFYYCDEAIDIQIDTVEEHRRKGIATACAARLILDCLDRWIFPNWSADCAESRYLAEKLGYELDKEDVSYAI